MSGATGHTFMYNIIILFILILFAFLAGTLSYYKAFKVNNQIISSIEKYEGYNDASKGEIETVLDGTGYQTGNSSKCPSIYRDMDLLTINNTEKYKYCIYTDKANPQRGHYYQYGVISYLVIDLPLINSFNIPIFTKTNRIYKLGN